MHDRGEHDQGCALGRSRGDPPSARVSSFSPAVASRRFRVASSPPLLFSLFFASAGKTPEEIRKTFNIRNDFTPEEEEEVRRENQWAFE